MERLATLFGGHPEWVAAAAYLDPRASTTVYFSHRPGEAWRLEERGGGIRLLPGSAHDPELVLRFSPGAVERLAAVSGGIGDFAVAVFERLLDDDPAERMDIRIVAPFWRLVERGYVRLLLAAGPQVLRFGLVHGVRNLSDLRQLVGRLREREPEGWDTSV